VEGVKRGRRSSMYTYMTMLETRSNRPDAFSDVLRYCVHIVQIGALVR